MKNNKTFTILLASIGLFAFASCSCDNHTEKDLPPVSGVVSVEGASESVGDARDLNIDASSRLAVAKAELKKAKEETEKAEVLIVKMRESKSPFTDNVEGLKNSCVSLIRGVTLQIHQTGSVLDKQLIQLRRAGTELNKAREASAKSEAEKDALRSYGKDKAEKLAKCEKEVTKLQTWKDKNMWYKKFFWWTLATVVTLAVAYIYFSGATGGLARFLRR